MATLSVNFFFSEKMQDKDQDQDLFDFYFSENMLTQNNQQYTKPPIIYMVELTD